MKRPPRRVLIGIAVAGLVGLAWAAALVHGHLDPRAKVEPLREELRTLRASADSCRRVVARGERRLEAYGDRVDSLRGRVRSYEELDERGVPADSYATYLEAFRRYNRTVPGWEERADSLRDRWERCRALVERHNLLADSLRGLLEEYELLEDGVAP